VEFRVDKTGNIHVPVGKVSFDDQALKENILAFFEELLNQRPQNFKGTYIRSCHLSPTMGPSVKVDVNDILKQTNR